MKGRDKKGLHSKTIEELNTLLREKRVALVKTRMELSMNKIKNVHAASALRREIAMIETIKQEKEIADA